MAAEKNESLMFQNHLTRVCNVRPKFVCVDPPPPVFCFFYRHSAKCNMSFTFVYFSKSGALQE